MKVLVNGIAELLALAGGQDADSDLDRWMASGGVR